MRTLVAKIHLRRLRSGATLVQGFILNPTDLPSDAIAACDLTLVEVEDRTDEYRGKSNEMIRREGFP